MQDWTPTREAGLARLRDFAPAMGQDYRARRNFDLGAGRHAAVSTLSPWLRRRLVLETEALAAAAGHAPGAADAFVREVVWRAYFKGWLEMRPGVWSDYCAALRDLPVEAAVTAEAGETGIAPFDAWVRELVETGYLHNHARMWFASIWVFTLKLPWQLGADFFLRHLLDGDPASNTCSWRWVAGLHTPGKDYLAQASNIARCTGGRFGPVEGLAREAVPIAGENPTPGRLRVPVPPQPGGASVRLVTEEDLAPETLPPVETRATATVQLTARRSGRPVSAAVAAWDEAALADAATRAGGAVAFRDPGPAMLADWAAGTGARQVVTAYIPVGWTRDWADGLGVELARRGLILTEQRRAYDATIWPEARAGFFRVRKKLPRLRAALGL